MSTKKLQIIDYNIKQAENADTVDGKHASDFASATDVNALQSKVGDTSVSEQISTAINAIDYPVDSVNGKTGAVTLTASDVGALPAGTEIPSISGLATEAYVDSKVAGIVDSAPETLDTLNELSAALGNDPNFATTVATQIGGKVDKVSGKGLSTNDYTTDEKNKLAGIETGANKTTVDTALSTTSTNPVQNKVVATQINNLNTLVGDKAVSDQISTAIADKVDKVSGKGLSTNDYTTTEKDKLAGIASGAEVNQNAFSNVVIGSTTIAADGKTDTLTLVAGNNVTLTPDATNDKITIAAKDTVYTHPTYTAKDSGLYKITVDGTGHVSGATAVAKADITALGIPAQDTTYSTATQSANGLMSSSDKTKLDGIASGANKTTVDSELSSTSTNPVQNKVINSAISNLNTLVGDTSVSSQITSAIKNKSDTGHTHDDRYYTESEVDSKLSGKSDTSHTHSTYVNQNAFSNVVVGSTTVAADTATDTLTLVAGSNVTLTPDATNDKITIAAKDTTYSAATTSAAGLMSAADKTKLDGIATGATKITVDSGLSSSSTNPVQNKVVNTAISNLNTLVGDKSVSSQISSATNDCITNLSVSGKTVTYTKKDGSTGTITTQDTNTTYSTMTGATSSAAGSAGLVPAPAAGKQASFLRGDGTWVVPTNTTYSNMTGATTSAAGASGLVPAPSKGAATRYLRSDGTWQVPPDTNTTYSTATTSANGLMSSSDKSKLDGIATGANKTTVDSALSSSSINPVQNKVVNTAISNLNTLVGDTAVSTQISNATNDCITGLSVSGKTITYTKKSGSTGTITTQDTNTTYSNATTSAAGLMSANDKSKLDGITASADSVSFSRSLTSGTKVGTITINGTGTDLYAPTNTWRGVQNNLTSDSTTDSLAAAQGKALKTLVDGKAASSHKHAKSDITDMPTSLPANGGNADTVDGKHASNFFNYIGVVADLFAVNQTCVCKYDANTLNTPLKAGLSNSGAGLCFINCEAGSTYVNYLVMPCGDSNYYAVNSSNGSVSVGWRKINDIGSAIECVSGAVGTNAVTLSYKTGKTRVILLGHSASMQYSGGVYHTISSSMTAISTKTLVNMGSHALQYAISSSGVITLTPSSTSAAGATYIAIYFN